MRSTVLLLAAAVFFLGAAHAVETPDDSPGERAAERGFLGIFLAPVPEALAAHVQVDGGAMVGEVQTGSPAEKAGLRRFDVIVSIEGEAIGGPAEVQKRIRSEKPGRVLKLGVKRGKDTLTLEAKLGSAPPEPAAPPAEGAVPAEKAEKPRPGFLGVGYAEVPQLLAFHLKIEPGSGAVVGDVWKDSPAAKAGIETHDVLLTLDGKAIEGPDDFRESIARRKAGEEIKIELMHKGEKKAIAAVLAEKPKDLRWAPRFQLRGAPDAPLPKDFDLLHPFLKHRSGKVILRGPQGKEFSLELPDAVFKAEDVIKDLELEFEKLKDVAVPELKQQLRKGLRELESYLDHPDGDVQWVSKEERSDVLRSVEGGFDITVSDRNGLRSVTVIQGGKTLAEDQPLDRIESLPPETRDRVKKLADELSKGQKRSWLKARKKAAPLPVEGDPQLRV